MKEPKNIELKPIICWGIVTGKGFLSEGNTAIYLDKIDAEIKCRFYKKTYGHDLFVMPIMIGSVPFPKPKNSVDYTI